MLQAKKVYPYRDPNLSPEERTRDLLRRMSVEEKIGQLIKLDGFRSYEIKDGHCRFEGTGNSGDSLFTTVPLEKGWSVS